MLRNTRRSGAFKEGAAIWSHVACEEQPHEALGQRLPALDGRRQLCLSCMDTREVSNAAQHSDGHAGSAGGQLVIPCQGDGKDSFDRGRQLASAA